ncbi:hypothetical protein [Natrinema sp. HArc-T2]|uniref:hypothetical protein n=1 Tax=Natrinema sp. HArc-T2 TaxID=3242701 RepID=UPI00359F0DE2
MSYPTHLLFFIGGLVGTTYITRGYFKALADGLEFSDISIVTGGFCLFATVFATGSTINGLARFLLICLMAGYTTSALYFRDERPPNERTNEGLPESRDDYGRLNLILIIGLSIAVILFPTGSKIPPVAIIGPTLFVLGSTSMAVAMLSLFLFRNHGS